MPTPWDEETHVSPDSEPVPEEAASRPCLILVSGANLGEVFPLLGEELSIGRAPPADVQIIDEGLSRKHARVFRQGEALVLEDLGSRNGTFCNGVRVTRHELRDGDKVQVGARTVFRFVRQELVDENYQRELFQASLRDVHTKAFNRRYFLDRLDSEFAYSTRHRVPLALVLFDLDRFGALNTDHGQAAGDYVLSLLSQRVAEWIRTEDVLARIGPDQFALICRGIDTEGARIFAERLRKKTEGTPFEHAGDLLPVSISLGAAAVSGVTDPTPQRLLEAAQRALAESKAGGRNRVTVIG
jgi:diguanylate cyclase (GGDEF)-like protein